MLIIINTKTYTIKEEKLITLLKKTEELSNRIKGMKFMIAAQAFNIKKLSSLAKKTIIATQHLDPFLPGRNTGFLIPFHAKKAGAKATLLNHSEHRLNINTIKKSVELIKKEKIKVILCSKTISEAKRLSLFNPDYIAIEPPSLIGTKNSVFNNRKFIFEAKKNINNLILGAGVNNHNDFLIAKSNKIKGILISSAIMKAKNPSFALEKFILG